jgi:hypothetical protein
LTRHELLMRLHALLQPKVYLEVGVHTGASLDLAANCETAIGIDPNPLRQSRRTNEWIWPMTSDDYFAIGDPTHPLVDLAFIDGSHLCEDALNDFINIEKLCHLNSVVVFDDVLPYNRSIASRIMPPGGDWTGDVWKVMQLLIKTRTDLNRYAVNTSPTGTFVVWGFEHPAWSLADYGNDVGIWTEDTKVPDDVLDRRMAVEPMTVLDKIKEDLCASQ